MPETPNLPDDNPETHPSPPQLPPELPDDDYTRVQGELSRTKGMPPAELPRQATGASPRRQEVTPPRPMVPPVPQPVRRVQPPSPPENWPPDKPKRGQPKPPPSRNALYLPVWSVVLTLFMVCGAVSCVVLGVVSLGGRMAPTLAPQFVVITAVLPTSTPFVPESLLASPIPNQLVQTGTVPAFSLAGPTLPPVEISPTPENIGVGKTIRVDSPDSGLNVRTGAGIQNDRLFVAQDGDTFTVVDGPTQADGLTWWKIESPTDPTRSGWAAAAYLQLIPATP